MAELGKMDRPQAEPFRKLRKLYLVPLVYAGEEAPAEYIELCDRYWEGVRASVESLEAGAGVARHIYHEVVASSGDEGLKMVERVSTKSRGLIKSKLDQGATIEAFEDEELLAEFLDWQRCLGIGFMSNKVASKVSESYFDAQKRRVEHLAKRIADTLGENEAGLLFISEDHKVQFPADIEVFYVAPPALDEIHRWLRERRESQAPGQEKDEG